MVVRELPRSTTATTEVTAPAEATAAVAAFVARGLIPEPNGLTVWDLGCGEGEYSAALAALGATVLGSDLVVHRDRVPSGVTVVEGDFDAVERHLGGSLDSIDLVFMHLMSEHVSDLKGFLIDLFGRLRPGTEVFINHDNYFQPLGHHDHGLLMLDPEQATIVARGPACWESRVRCARSLGHRIELSATLPWLWSSESEATTGTDACGSCNYFRRSQPWAHLRYGDELRATFPESWFRTQLNRMTPNQVLWDVQDAGFEILRAERVWLMNDVPDDLERLYGRETLSTMSLALRLARPA